MIENPFRVDTYITAQNLQTFNIIHKLSIIINKIWHVNGEYYITCMVQNII